ncbi:hypothetical protein BN1723_010964 [Verticillium longisporum]|uniref:Uncharacterized protein n=1 Tax=Verticillium longisporum TaxID=100787 RepID=A0A0G4L319_VERLO|nr:hypothetical protein BN1723_010964 [Verticillium longisporum]
MGAAIVASMDRHDLVFMYAAWEAGVAAPLTTVSRVQRLGHHLLLQQGKGATVIPPKLQRRPPIAATFGFFMPYRANFNCAAASARPWSLPRTLSAFR